MLEMYLSRTITAKDFCTIAHWASLSGVAEAKDYAFRPEAPSGHFQRFLDSKLLFLKQTEHLYTMSIPTYSKPTIGRGKHDLVVAVPHELLDESLRGDDAFAAQLAEAIDSVSLPPRYFEHPVVLRNPNEKIFPVSLFVDGVPYSLTDGVIGYWLLNEITQARFLIATARNKNVLRMRMPAVVYALCHVLVLGVVLSLHGRGEVPNEPSRCVSFD